MENGKVKFYNKEKKFGFITGDDGKDYYFHASGISSDIYLRDGDKVEFKVVDGDRGPKAVEISIIWFPQTNKLKTPRTAMGFFVNGMMGRFNAVK